MSDKASKFTNTLQILADHQQALVVVVPSWQKRPLETQPKISAPAATSAPASRASSGVISAQRGARNPTAQLSVGAGTVNGAARPGQVLTETINAWQRDAGSSSHAPSIVNGGVKNGFGTRSMDAVRPFAEESFVSRKPDITTDSGLPSSSGTSRPFQNRSAYERSDSFVKPWNPTTSAMTSDLLVTRSSQSADAGLSKLARESTPRRPHVGLSGVEELLVSTTPEEFAGSGNDRESIHSAQVKHLAETPGAHSGFYATARMDISPAASASSPSPSLADSIGINSATSSKRLREDPSPVGVGRRPSLLSRLGSQNGPEIKRAKENPLAPEAEAPSLLLRMGRHSTANTSMTLSSPVTSGQSQSAPSSSVRSRATSPPIAIRAINILNRSASPTRSAAGMQTHPIPSPSPAQVNLDRAQQPAVASLTIRNHSKDIATIASEFVETGITRKGRGFQRGNTPEDIIMLPPTSLPTPLLHRMVSRRPKFTSSLEQGR